MTGARKFAFDRVLPAVPDGCRVLDVGCGDSPLAGMLAQRGCVVTAVDKAAAWFDLNRRGVGYFTTTHNLAETPWPFAESFDRIVAIYSLQHLMEHEAQAWAEVRRLLKPDGKAIIVQRYAETCRLELGRADPLNAYSEEGIWGLAQSVGLCVESITFARYDGDEYTLGLPAANVFAAVLTK